MKKLWTILRRIVNAVFRRKRPKDGDIYPLY
jgi:hypothetical protein